MDIRTIDAHDTWELRHKVLWPERDLEYVKVANDPEGFHFGLYYEGELIAVVSVFISGQEAQLRKLALEPRFQGRGYGTNLVAFVIEELQRMGLRRVWCRARKNKQSFYERLGMQTEGKAFIQDGMEYVRMGKELQIYKISDG